MMYVTSLLAFSPGESIQLWKIIFVGGIWGPYTYSNHNGDLLCLLLPMYTNILSGSCIVFTYQVYSWQSKQSSWFSVLHCCRGISSSIVSCSFCFSACRDAGGSRRAPVSEQDYDILGENHLIPFLQTENCIPYSRSRRVFLYESMCASLFVSH